MVYMDSILIVKTSSIGDVIQSLAVLEYLHHRFPQAKIDWIVERPSASLLEAHPYIHQVKIVDTKKWRAHPLAKETRQEIQKFRADLQAQQYDLLFDLQGNIKSGLIDFFCKAKKKIGFSKTSVPETPNLWFTNTHIDLDKHQNISLFYLKMIQNFFEDAVSFEPSGVKLNLNSHDQARLETVLPPDLSQKGPLFMVALGSYWKNKQLSDEMVIELLSFIRSNYQARFIFVYQGVKEKMKVLELSEPFADCSTLIGEMTLVFWHGLMQKMDGVISVDSAGLHLAAASGVPTFSVFGPSAAEVYKPSGKMHIAIQGSCPYNQTFIRRCPYLRSCKTGACIKDLKVNAVIDRFKLFYSGLLSLKADQNQCES
ncbi:MAG: lipopolysaccharide heptosyltransferase family protein [Chlamydiia bacterium]|nr:lipopolysaccharide heptosyltransferase family protein [Chlamydiia bacterium]